MEISASNRERSPSAQIPFVSDVYNKAIKRRAHIDFCAAILPLCRDLYYTARISETMARIAVRDTRRVTRSLIKPVSPVAFYSITSRSDSAIKQAPIVTLWQRGRVKELTPMSQEFSHLSKSNLIFYIYLNVKQLRIFWKTCGKSLFTRERERKINKKLHILKIWKNWTIKIPRLQSFFLFFFFEIIFLSSLLFKYTQIRLKKREEKEIWSCML